jgi:hypothetical protein
MTNRDPSTRPTKSLAISLATGALLVPLSAFGASSLLSASTEEPPPPALASTTTVGASPTADLGVACGEEGMQLVAAEAGGFITEVQQAALDALRDICAAANLPLPGPAVPTAPSTPPASTVPATTVTTTHSDDDDHGRHGGDRDDDREDDDREDDD